jgi:hypothetical protein
MQSIGVREQGYIGGGELARKAALWTAIALGQRGAVEEAAHQPGELLPGVARGALQVAQHHAFVGAPQASVAKASEYRADKAVALHIVAEGAELDLEGATEKGAQLRHRAESRFVHVDHHVRDDRPKI